ncbi:MAG: TATA-box-binding protein [Thermoplasmata archaeon]|nr:TATA-box-binding protein [Thermoplasmata archaeon]
MAAKKTGKKTTPKAAKKTDKKTTPKAAKKTDKKGVQKTEVSIENIVASTVLAEKLDLTAVALALEGAEYEPEQFPGLVYRLKSERTAILLFRSGKANCTGAKTIESVQKTIKTVSKKLEDAGLAGIIKKPEITVQNIVAVYDLKSDLNLNAIAITLGLERVEYEPEQFPGLVYRVAVPKVVMLLFGSGKVVCTGAKQEADIITGVETLKKELRAAGLLRTRVEKKD